LNHKYIDSIAFRKAFFEYEELFIHNKMLLKWYLIGFQGVLF
jgi:hypothetical protein